MQIHHHFKGERITLIRVNCQHKVNLILRSTKILLLRRNRIDMQKLY